MTYLTDSAVLDRSTIREVGGGGVVCQAKVARTGIQLYTGDELGKPEMPVVRVYRPEDEVFARDAMASYAHKPVTIGHPKALVDSTTYTKTSVGHLGEQVVRDGEFVSVPILVMDAKAVDLVKGKTEFSMGYEMSLDWTPGVTADGEAYDVVQRNMRMNHVALVDSARGGHQLTVDSKQELKMHKTIVVDGLTINCADADTAYSAINTLMDRNKVADARIEELTKAVADAEAKVTKAEAEKAVAEKAVKDAAVTPAQLDKMVADREAVRESYKAITGKDADTTMDTAALKAAAVRHALGDKAPEEAGIGYAFDALVAQKATAAPDPLRSALSDGTTVANDETAFDNQLLEAAGVAKPK